jgi:hypothetical protein
LLGKLSFPLYPHSDSSYSSSADFNGYRYVDQIPWITTVPSDTAAPSVALAAGLEAVGTAHRPLAVSFDFYPHGVLILPPNCVFTTFEQSVLTPRRDNTSLGAATRLSKNESQ